MPALCCVVRVGGERVGEGSEEEKRQPFCGVILVRAGELCERQHGREKRGVERRCALTRTGVTGARRSVTTLRIFTSGLKSFACSIRPKNW